MNTNQTVRSSLRRRALTATTAAMLAGLFTIAGTTHAQEKTGSAPAVSSQTEQAKHHRMDPAKRFDRMINRLVPDATPEQKTKLQAIAKSAFEDLRPLREKSRAAHAESMKLLAQPTIDRAALERVRQTQQQLADQRSRRMTQAFADAAEVLTPAQRTVAAEKLAKREGHHGFHGHHGHHDRDGQGKDAAK
ncbi:MAG TPA: Spy/CpxP family protein refolding chaperone [Oxalicibacterium sp.]|nr:Spy/CpxP family protein refolding chaperone [Oxalicibacterium sp.]